MLQPGDELGRSVCIEKAEQSELIERIRDTVRTGILGEDYTIIPRDKNRWLRRDYNITDIRIRQILLDLQMGDFVKAAKSDQPKFAQDIIYVFKKDVSLLPRWQEEADYIVVRLYIKITWPREDLKMLIISFHEDNI